MAYQIAVIKENHGDGWATVVTDRKGGCSGCQSYGGGCRSCLSPAKVETQAANPVNAQTGDMVRLNLRTSDLFKGAAILYLIPVVSLISAAFLGVYLARNMGWPETASAVLAGLIGVLAGAGIVILADRSLYVRRRMTPTITAVVQGQKRRQPKPPTCCDEQAREGIQNT